jgi:dihydrofolate reductase
MIRFIAAIDSLRGVANEQGIPWDLPTDTAYYRKQVSSGGKILMGYNTYKYGNHAQTIKPNSTEYVAMSHVEPLRAGFEAVDDVDSFLKRNELVWVLGGAGLFASTLQHADELYITQVCGDFGCTVFFPAFEHDFFLYKRKKIMRENGIDFQYQIWKNKKYAVHEDLNRV